jgi:hypothetical protein
MSETYHPHFSPKIPGDWPPGSPLSWLLILVHCAFIGSGPCHPTSLPKLQSVGPSKEVSLFGTRRYARNYFLCFSKTIFAAASTVSISLICIRIRSLYSPKPLLVQPTLKRNPNALHRPALGLFHIAWFRCILDNNQQARLQSVSLPQWQPLS